MRYGKGPLGALMDEYERAMEEFIGLIEQVDPALYTEILDPVTKHEECRSIALIAHHVIMGAYGYAEAIRTAFGMSVRPDPTTLTTQAEFAPAMRSVFDYTEETFHDKWSMNDDDLTNMQIPIPWSDHHDLEAMLEHAIVHILRHRRQIEYLVQKKNSNLEVNGRSLNEATVQ